MSREKKERKQFGSVTASLVIAFFVVSSVAFLENDYVLGQTSDLIKSPKENPFYLHDYFIDGNQEEGIPSTNSFLYLEKWDCPDPNGIGCEEIAYPRYQIRANKVFHALAGLRLGEGVVITEINHTVRYEGESIGNNESLGESTAYQAFSYDSTMTSRDQEERIVSMTAKKKEERVPVFLDVDGTVRADPVSKADGKLQIGVQEIQDALKIVSKIRGVTFYWEDGDRGDGQQMGVVAQELEEIVPQVVSVGYDGVKSVAYGKLSGLLIEATKELNENDSVIISENNKLREEVSRIMKENEYLKNLTLLLAERVKKIEAKLFLGKDVRK
ncbi:MAG: tail fiber domain-containing protein [Planctomycetes bacterium]|nr:tail fiber domain-containing protein [Planctomycetota bacterium]